MKNLAVNWADVFIHLVFIAKYFGLNLEENILLKLNDPKWANLHEELREQCEE